jgi:hypothetical protein
MDLDYTCGHYHYQYGVCVFWWLCSVVWVKCNATLKEDVIPYRNCTGRQHFAQAKY